MADIRHITILHSNDMHGDFLPKDENGVQTGGLPLLAGYINKVRAEEDNVFYAVAGDMFRGSVIDSEYQGLSTIELVNLLQPDAAIVGNHEIDYGIGHLLFLEKCATFPIVNSDLYVTTTHSRLFRSHMCIEVGGINILVIGILTNDVLAAARQQSIGTFLDLDEAVEAVTMICDNYRTVDTDLIVLLTHLGIEQDKQLAEKLSPELGVDLIIGGHSHTFMDAPEVINGIPIAQAGTGTGIIGRFDIDVDLDNNKLKSFSWKCVPVNEKTASPDPVMFELLESYRVETDKKYKRVICRFPRALTHPKREQETELGNLYADMLQDCSSFDIMLLGSGSIRKKEMGPIVEYQDAMECTPFDDALWMVRATGAQLRRIVLHILRDDAWLGETEFYQFSKGFRVVYRAEDRKLIELKLNGKDIEDSQMYRIAVTSYHYASFDEFLGVPLEELSENGEPVKVAMSIVNIYQEYFRTHPVLDAYVEGRLVVI